jgi:hypothetical protein
MGRRRNAMASGNLEHRRGARRAKAGRGLRSGPNEGLEPTPSSVRSAPASGRGSGPALGRVAKEPRRRPKKMQQASTIVAICALIVSIVSLGMSI